MFDSAIFRRWFWGQSNFLEMGDLMPARQFRLFWGLMVASIVGLCMAASAEPVKQHNSNAVWFESWGALSNATMVVTAPDGKLTRIEAASGTPVFRLQGGPVLDGVYTYELTAATDKRTPIINPINNGRGDAAKTTVAVSYATNGSFTVYRGVIVTPEDINEGSDG